MRARVVLPVLAIAAAVLGSTGCNKLKAHDSLNHGVQAFRSAQYPQAADFFRQAVDMDPGFTSARLYLATSYMVQYIPGAESPENAKNVEAAMTEFHKVLDQEPKNQLAIADIASLYFNEKKWDDAEQWYRKLITVNPNSKEAYYTLGVIAWTRWITPDREARNKMGMKPEDPGPLKDKKVKADLKAKWDPILDQGIADEERALQIDPHYDQAMAYLNLLIRYKADLADTPADFKKQSDIADNWVQKSLETAKVNAEKKAAAAANGATTK